MRTSLHRDNPFGESRYGYGWEHVPAGGAAHLDVGCGDGRFLAALQSKRIGRLVGIDASRQAVALALRQLPGVEVLHLRGGAKLPFADGEFSSISLLDVLEHVDGQDDLLTELHRILSDDGVLVVTVPGRHLFSCLDMGNLKFRFPRLHRRHYCRRHSREEYEHRYVSNPDGLIGDVSATKRWHEHFSRSGLESLLTRNGFSVAEFDGAGLFVRVLKIADVPLSRIGALRSAVGKLMAWDARCFGSANLFCLATKSGRGTHAAQGSR